MPLVFQEGLWLSLFLQESGSGLRGLPGAGTQGFKHRAPVIDISLAGHMVLLEFFNRASLVFNMGKTHPLPRLQ